MFENQTESPNPMVIAFEQRQDRRIAGNRFDIAYQQIVAPN
jgi:hypothetical protein